MKFLLTLASLVAAVSANGAEHSGHAAAELIAASSSYQASKPIEAAIRLKVDPGWHTYWINPGEGGMKLGVEWKLPAGWKAGAVEWPMPGSFKTGDLPGYGYFGEIILPVTLTPPTDAAGKAEIGVKLSWLTCNEEACVPGDVSLQLDLKSGETAVTPQAEEISKAKATVPKPLEGLSLAVKEDGKNLVLTVVPGGSYDLSKAKVFPATAEVVANSATIQFAKSGDVWTASVPKSEYLTAAPKSLELVLSGGGLPHPTSVGWSQ